MIAKHTPGPWTVATFGDQIEVIKDSSKTIAAVTRGNREANARLIAAAPELLDSLKRIVCAVDYAGALGGELGREIIKDCYVTIAKAEGSDATFKEQHG